MLFKVWIINQISWKTRQKDSLNFLTSYLGLLMLALLSFPLSGEKNKKYGGVSHGKYECADTLIQWQPYSKIK